MRPRSGFERDEGRTVVAMDADTTGDAVTDCVAGAAGVGEPRAGAATAVRLGEARAAGRMAVGGGIPRGREALGGETGGSEDARVPRPSMTRRLNSGRNSEKSIAAAVVSAATTATA